MFAVRLGPAAIVADLLFGIYRRTLGRLDLHVRDYTVLAIAMCVAVLVLELRIWRTGLFRLRAYRITMMICLGFMVLVNGWLTKLSAPIVTYTPGEFSRWRPIWDVPLEDFAFGFAMLTFSLLCWVRTETRRTPFSRSSNPDGTNGAAERP